jgi:hypothetical protein
MISLYLVAVGTLFLVGIAALTRLVQHSTLARAAIPSALVNLSLACCFLGLLFAGHVAIWLAAGFPLLLATVAGTSVRRAESVSARTSGPPKLVPLFPTRTPTVLLLVCVLLVVGYRLREWRSLNEETVTSQVDSRAVVAIANSSPNARKHLDRYFAKFHRNDVAPQHTLHICGAVVRLAEKDGAPFDRTAPTVSVCRRSLSYATDLGLP